MTDTLAPARKGFTLNGWHVLAVFSGVFGVMLAVNILFVVLALKTMSGETDHAYINGLKFNETLAAKARQHALGWSMALGLERPAGGGAVLEARLTDRAGQPLQGAQITGHLGRTTSDDQDQSLRFVEREPGHYRAIITQLAPGRWRFEAHARLGDNPVFETETTLSLR